MLANGSVLYPHPSLALAKKRHMFIFFLVLECWGLMLLIALAIQMMGTMMGTDGDGRIGR